jgi:hypothetical protein
VITTSFERFVDAWAQRQLVAKLIPNLQWRWHGIGALQAYWLTRTRPLSSSHARPAKPKRGGK